MSAVDRLAGRVRLMVARAVLRVVDDAAKLQAVQVQLQADVVRDKAEHFQGYGFTSHPLPGAEGIALSVGGSTDHVVVINIDDRRYRLHLQPGEAAIYDDLGHRVHLTRNGIEIDGAGHAVLMKNLTKLRVEGDVEVVGHVRDLADSASGKTMADMRQVYNGHDHVETQQITGKPNQSM